MNGVGREGGTNKRQNNVRVGEGGRDKKERVKTRGRGGRVKSKLSTLPQAQFPGHD